MISPPLLTIGAFARAVGLTASSLRHYDECGLLVPAEVDRATGYRYYTPDLAERARLIGLMRDAGVPIESMRRVLDGPPDRARTVLEAFVEERTTLVARAESSLQEVLAVVEAGDAGARPVRLDVDGAVLASALRQVRPAADLDPGSPLGGVLVDAGEGTLDVVATNRYWMGVRSLGPAAVTGDGARAVVPLAAVAGLADRLDRCGTVTLQLDGRRLAVVCPGEGEPHTVEGLAGAYPAHRILVAGLEPRTTRAVISSADLAEGIERSARAEVALELTATGATVAAAEAGSDPHPVRGVVEGESVRVLLGAPLARRCLASCLGDEVVVEVSAEDRPVVLRSPYQPGFLALLMPIRPA